SEPIIEGRRRVLEETLAALNVTNVTFAENRAIVKGQRSTYSVHLGSGVVHLPSGRQLALAVADDRDEALYLPFADPDPAMARIVAAVLMLADDADIRDAAIVRQLETA